MTFGCMVIGHAIKWKRRKCYAGDNIVACCYKESGELAKLAAQFKYETDEELNRKREVYRSFVISQTTEKIAEDSKNLEFNRQAYESLSKIIQKRERARIRREFLGELLQWSGLLAPFIGGVFASPYIRTVLTKIIN